MGIANELAELNLISGDQVKKVFDDLYQDSLTITMGSGSDFIRSMWARYDNQTPSLNGKVFEGLLAICLYRMGIRPIYLQAKLAFIPNVDFDFILYSREIGPVVLSTKTSLRERYKQADLEGMMLRQVHRKARTYLITMNEVEANSVNDKIRMGAVLGIDSVVTASLSSFDVFLSELQQLDYIEPPSVQVITSNKIIK